MSLPKRRNELIHQVISPAYLSLLESRFAHTHWEHIHEHVHGTLAPIEFVPTDTENEFSKSYEVLYRKWNLKLLTDEEFVLELDGLMTKFLLTQINHKEGTRSPEFHKLISIAVKFGIGMGEEFKQTFKKIHQYRTGGLHRLISINREEIAATAMRVFVYFRYFDEFSASQLKANEMLHGTLYPRLKYGKELWLDENGMPYSLKDERGEMITAEKLADRQPCHDCGAVKGQYHCTGCDIEECPRCHGQLLSCDCRTEQDIEYYENLEEED